MAALALESYSNPAFQADRIDIREWPSTAARAYVGHAHHSDWVKTVGRRLGDLMRLPRGWDGYDAEPVDFLTAHFATNVLQQLCRFQMPAPQVVPGTEGDLQIEWHEPVASIEIHVIEPNKVRAWRRINATGDETELNLSNNFNALLPWMQAISEPIIAANAAAN